MSLRKHLLEMLWLPRETSLYLLKHPEGVIYRCQNPRNIVYTGEELIITPVEDYAVDIRVGDRLLLGWLWQTYESVLSDFPPFLIVQEEIRLDSQFYLLQYSHARCCTYLRQLLEQQIITSEARVILTHDLVESLSKFNAYDWNLLKAIALVNDLTSFSRQSINYLSQAVLNFERYSGIWRDNFTLREIKAMLLILARYYLHIFLSESSVRAPIAL